MSTFKSLPAQEVKYKGSKYLQLDLQDALDKLPLQLLYYKEHGHKDFIVYASSKGRFSYANMFGKIMKSLYKLMDQHEIHVVFRGFPKCIFEQYILPPAKRWKYGSYLAFDEDIAEEELSKPDLCKFCAHNDVCAGVFAEYLNSYKKKEFIPILSNTDRVDLYSEELSSLGSDELQGIADMLLDDMGKDSIHKQRYFYLLTSYPGMEQKRKRTGVGYFIYNVGEEFERNFTLFSHLFSMSSLDKVKAVLAKSREFLLKFELLEEGSLRKSLEFAVDELEDEDITLLEEILGREVKGRKVVLYEEEEPRVYNLESSIQIMKIKELMKDIPLERKRNILRFLNSQLKPIKDFIYAKGENSLSFLVCIDKNASKIHQLALLFKLDLGYLREKKLSHLHFEIFADKDEKVTFLYSIDEQKELTKEEEEEFVDYYSEA